MLTIEVKEESYVCVQMYFNLFSLVKHIWLGKKPTFTSLINKKLHKVKHELSYIY